MFTPGSLYVRRELHEKLGGQEQGGISTPADQPVVLIFTGQQGVQYGYHDGWTDDGLFLYTGEGQRGDMQFVRGNSAIRDHAMNGKDLLLFSYVDRGRVRYEGQMVFAGFERQRGPDLDGNDREVIIFHLLPIDALARPSDTDPQLDEDIRSLPTDQLRQKAIAQASEPRTPRESKKTIHYRSAAVREYVLRRAGPSCEGCGKDAPFLTPEGRPYLEPHHIRRVSDGGPDHPAFVAAVCPNCHARAHYSADKHQFNGQLGELIRQKEQPVRADA